MKEPKYKFKIEAKKIEKMNLKSQVNIFAFENSPCAHHMSFSYKQ